MTVEQLALDCDPDWNDDIQPADDEDLDRPPSPFALRQAELRDQQDQGASRYALWTAHNVPTGSYL
ncbi:hypothetical protein GCM10010330_56830 [Streptomyces tendae]|uniref:hypothetical protein n=1 Tax=Streptomyces tendae TaxID=1932 RepID=UPI0016780DD5|nr:hypothetical protein [Streptomyces tendae]GHA95313.1 hypothetical protein GCM10010330_56830 [Streptomyces tendae]